MTIPHQPRGAARPAPRWSKTPARSPARPCRRPRSRCHPRLLRGPVPAASSQTASVAAVTNSRQPTGDPVPAPEQRRAPRPAARTAPRAAATSPRACRSAARTWPSSSLVSSVFVPSGSTRSRGGSSIDSRVRSSHSRVHAVHLRDDREVVRLRRGGRRPTPGCRPPRVGGRGRAATQRVHHARRARAAAPPRGCTPRSSRAGSRRPSPAPARRCRPGAACRAAPTMCIGKNVTFIPMKTSQNAQRPSRSLSTSGR